MTTQYTLHIAIADTLAPDGAVGILVPVPPTTPHQRVNKLVLDAAWSTLPVTAQSGIQSAIFATMPSGAQITPIEIQMIDCGMLDKMHFADAVCVNASAEKDALQLADELKLSQCRDEIERLEAIVDSLAHKFQYQSGYKNDAPLTCDILTGNCLSINDAFLKMTKIAGIPSVYYIGYFFQSEQPLHSNDWHCWVSTLTTRGYESWDIAHHLKRGLRDIEPALNPVPGIRFATSVGRDLVFALPFAEVKVPHLCEPRWIFKDGTSKRCDVCVSIEKSDDVPEAESSAETHAFVTAPRNTDSVHADRSHFLKEFATP